VEEFTGVRCVNCPAGAAELENLKTIYGDRLVVISIHAGDFAPPFTESRYDFRTTEGTALETFLGAALGYPTAVVNRRKFTGQSSLQVTKANWAGFIASESNAPSVLNLSIQKNYTKDKRLLDLNVKIVPTEKLPDDSRLTVVLTENDILDWQETPQGKKSDYKHKHVLRRVLTNDVKGVALGTTTAWTTSVSLPNNWLIENCRIVAFVHRGGDIKDVLQVQEVKILD
jgi:hypothetical protein